MFTGVASADIYPSGFVRLTYTDASTEGAHLTQAQLIKGREEFFSLVSSVQSHRPNTLKNS
jgi:hypothetical protein